MLFFICAVPYGGQDGVSNVVITPRSSTYQPGDDLICSADGNPEPKYQWKNLVTGDISNDGKIVISKSLTNSSSWILECVASNYVDGDKKTASTNISFTIKEDKPATNGMSHLHIHQCFGY